MGKINILTSPYKNVDEAVLAEGAAELIDGYIDELGALNKRPGLWLWWSAKIPAHTDGVYWWKAKRMLLTVCGSRVFVFKALDQAPVEISTPDLRLFIGNRVSFDATETAVFMANGGKLFMWDGTTPTMELVESEYLPGYISSVTYLNSRLLVAEVGSPRVYLTEAIEAATVRPVWKPTFFRPDANPDSLSLLGSAFSELMLFGESTVEPWYYTGEESDSASIPFAPISGTLITRGVSAPGSVVQAANTWFWLDHERKIIQLDGRTPKIISIPIDRVLQNLSRVDDATACWYKNWYIITFPTDGVTYVYNVLTSSWDGRWAKWNPTTGLYEAWLGQTAVYAAEWGVWFIGGRANGNVYIIHPNFLTDAGETIRLLFRSAHMDHGTMARKQSKELMLRLKRGN